jgi:hypothetical protein
MTDPTKIGDVGRLAEYIWDALGEYAALTG